MSATTTTCTTPMPSSWPRAGGARLLPRGQCVLGAGRGALGGAAGNAKQADIGKKRIDDALVLIEQENPRLKGILDKRFARASCRWQARRAGGPGLHYRLWRRAGATRATMLGQVYEYFLGEFANAEGKKGGQFYTPPASCRPWWRCSRRTMARSTTLLRLGRHVRVQSERFIESHGGKLGMSPSTVRSPTPPPGGWRP